MTISGGAGILMTDECIARGMQLSQLAPETLAKLREIVPSFGSLNNPVDVTAAIFNDLSLINRTMQTIIDDPNVDCLAMINASLQGELAQTIATEIVAVAAKTDKPVLIAWSARDAVAPEAYALLDAARIPHYKSPVRCGRALCALSWYAEARRRNEAQRGEQPLRIEKNDVKQRLAGQTADVSEHAAKRILADYGIGVTQEELATSQAQALAIAKRIGYPVALKVQSPDISHKTEAKAVRLGIASDQELASAYDEVLAQRARVPQGRADRRRAGAGNGRGRRRGDPRRHQRSAVRPGGDVRAGRDFRRGAEGRRVPPRAGDAVDGARDDRGNQGLSAARGRARTRARRRRRAGRCDRQAVGARASISRTTSPNSISIRCSCSSGARA